MTTFRHANHDATCRLPTLRKIAGARVSGPAVWGYLSILLHASLLPTARVSAGKPDDRPDKVIYEAPAIEAPSNPRAAQTPVPTPVSLGMDDAFQERVNIHDLDELSVERIEAANEEAAQKYVDIHPAPPRIGLSREIPFAPLSLDNEDFVETELEDGRSVWTLAIRSPGAYGIRVHFSNFDVGRGAVIVYGRGESGLVVRGPYTGRGTLGAGEFYAAPVPGDEVFVELTGHEPPRFEIGEIVHFDRDPYGRDQIDSDRGETLLSCHKDVNCYSSVPVNARKATGQMIYQSGGTSHSCTGTLINDLDNETWVPYFLTARHCISTTGAANSLIVTWLYETDYCIDAGGTVPDPSTLQISDGATIVRTQSENDMSFLRLSGSVPSGTALAGWTTSTSINGWGVHHPQGSWKRTVRLSPAGLCVTCVCLDPTDYDYYDMDIGLVQGGSSGSGIFNSASQIAGQLRKRCFDPDSMTCSNISDYFAVYGEFETTYDEISHWLFLGGTVNVDWSTPSFIPETGTPAFPFDTVTEGYNAVWPGARLKIQTGNYPENITFAKKMTVVGAGGSVLIGG